MRTTTIITNREMTKGPKGGVRKYFNESLLFYNNDKYLYRNS